MLSSAEAATVTNKLRTNLSDASLSITSKARRALDAKNLLAAEIVEWLARQGLGDDTVNVYWAYQREGVQMQFTDFLGHLDELWLPGSDDVIVESTKNKFVLSIDHEEQIQVVFPSATVSPRRGGHMGGGGGSGNPQQTR